MIMIIKIKDTVNRIQLDCFKDIVRYLKRQILLIMILFLAEFNHPRPLTFKLRYGYGLTYAR